MAKIKPGQHGSKKEVIIAKASALFRVKGFNAASMRELAESVGVEAPSLYNHIGSKSELLHSICFKIANEFIAHFESVDHTSVSTVNKIEDIIRFHISMMLERFDEVFVANHEWKYLKEPHLTEFLNQRRSYEKRFVALIVTGIKSKELKPINPYVAVLTILSSVRGLEFWQRHKKNVRPRVLEDDMVSHLLKGMVF